MHSRARTRTHGRGEKTLLKTLFSSGWTLIRSELSSPNINSSVRAERSFAIRYLNVVIKPLCGNLDICLNYYFRSQNSVCVFLVADYDWKWKTLFWITLFGSALVQFSVCTYYGLMTAKFTNIETFGFHYHSLSRGAKIFTNGAWERGSWARRRR